MIINVYRSLSKVPVFFLDFKETWTVLTGLQNIIKYQIS
jgi:hypothetical protein